MKVYIINLCRRKGRRAYMEAQVKNLGLLVTFVEGVDGRTLPREIIKRSVNAFRWWCVTGITARAGEVGCGLSHQSIYSEIIREGQSCACILEDDIELNKEFLSVLAATEDFIAQQGQSPVVVLMTPHPNRGAWSRRTAKIEFEEKQWAYSAGGYVVNKEAAIRLLRINVPMNGPIDNWGRWVRLCGLKLFDCWPIVCAQARYGSAPAMPWLESDTIDSDTVFVKDCPLLQKVMHKCLRIIGIICDRILPL